MKIMKCNRNAAAAQPPKSETVRKSQLQQDQQFEKRLRIAERLVQALRELGTLANWAMTAPRGR